MISRFALSKDCVRLLNSKFYLNDSGLTVQSNDSNIILQKYLAYYLYTHQTMIYNMARGTGQKNLDIDSFKSIKIPIPSIEHQKEIIEFLDKLFTDKYNLLKVVKYYENNDIFRLLLDKKYDIFEKLVEWQYQSTVLTKQIEFFKDRQARYLYLVKISENNIKTLGDICEVNPENMKSGQYTEINYIDISSVKNGQILELQYLTNNFPSRAKRIVKKGDILYSSVRPNLKGYVYINDNINNGIASTGFAQIRVKDSNEILSKYLYYIITSDYITNDLINKAKGAQYPAVSFDDFENLKIPIPSLERQQEIVNYCKNNDKLIKKLEQEIETNKEHATLFIKSIVKIQANPSEDETDIEDTLDYEQE